MKHWAHGCSGWDPGITSHPFVIATAFCDPLAICSPRGPQPSSSDDVNIWLLADLLQVGC